MKGTRNMDRVAAPTDASWALQWLPLSLTTHMLQGQDPGPRKGGVENSLSFRPQLSYGSTVTHLHPGEKTGGDAAAPPEQTWFTPPPPIHPGHQNRTERKSTRDIYLVADGSCPSRGRGPAGGTAWVKVNGRNRPFTLH